MPSFDVMSEIDTHELTNALDQANRELTNRFDFKGQDAKYVLETEGGAGKSAVVVQHAPSDFQLKQMLDILKARLVARKIDVRTLDVADAEIALGSAKQRITLKQGIEREFAKKIIALLKEAKIKVDTQIQGEKLRIVGKKKDDLQLAMALIRHTELDMPVQFENFRD
jgi:cyclic-di-GMP-binding protein